MREIRFRAWDEQEKEMLNNVNPIFSSKGNLDFLILEHSFCGYDLGEIEIKKYYSSMFSDNLEIPVVLMQYTGLTDKNGVEIFEGDWVQVEGMFPNEPFKVWYRNGMYHIGNWNLQGFMNAFDFYEVVGNIYENNDLLEEEK